MASIYYYEAINSEGQRLSGHVEAESSSAVSDQLYRSGNFAVEIRESSIIDGRRSNASYGLLQRPPTRQQVTTLIREVAMLVAAGLPLVEALSMVARDIRSKSAKTLTGRLRSALEDGKSFHEALAEHPASFDAFVVNMVRVGEASGRLASTLERIADARERDQKVRGKLWSAMLYPMFLVTTAVMAVAIMLGFVVPRFKAMIINAQVAVPGEAQLLIAASDWIVVNWQEAALVLSLIVLLLLVMLRSGTVRRQFDAVMFRLPLIGHLKRINLTFRFCRAIGTLLDSGVELPKALMLTRDLFGNQKIERFIVEANEALRKGQDFTVPLERSQLFQPVAIGMLRVGQETGDLADAARRTADMAEEKFEIATQRFFTILEPAIILLVSLFVAGVIVSIIGAIISVNDLVV
ncbi:MAG: type II secretion system F family protein [Hyphomicrobiaceae bacterium]